MKRKPKQDSDYINILTDLFNSATQIATKLAAVGVNNKEIKRHLHGVLESAIDKHIEEAGKPRFTTTTASSKLMPF
jgi:phage gpG-like protein